MATMDEVAGVMRNGGWWTPKRVTEALGTQRHIATGLIGLFAHRKVERRAVPAGSNQYEYHWTGAPDA
jgi:hypothetical protein